MLSDTNIIKSTINYKKSNFTGDHGSANHTGHGSKSHVSYSIGFLGNCAQY
jgi:hypothetical protein